MLRLPLKLFPLWALGQIGYTGSCIEVGGLLRRVAGLEQTSGDVEVGLAGRSLGRPKSGQLRRGTISGKNAADIARRPADQTKRVLLRNSRAVEAPGVPVLILARAATPFIDC